MSAFSKAGIYVWLDLDTFNTTIVQTAPTWTEEQFAAFAQVMDVFQGYDNLAGFWIGNEVINTAAGSPSAPYIKAAVADMKSYMAAKKYRTIPIGYSAADIAELRPMLQNYLACGSHPEQAIDFFGLNSYEWCGDATYTTSGYANLQQMSETYNLPIFFSETGCNVPAPRTFLDQDAIFGSNMVSTWSGSIIYEWVEETNHYGIVTYPNGQIYSGAPIPLQPDYNNLANVWKNINPTGVSQSGYTPSFAAPACPLATAGWAINGDVLLPTLGPNVVSAMAANKVVLPSSSPIASSSTAHTTSATAAGKEIFFSTLAFQSDTGRLVGIWLPDAHLQRCSCSIPTVNVNLCTFYRNFFLKYCFNCCVCFDFSSYAFDLSFCNYFSPYLSNLSIVCNFDQLGHILTQYRYSIHFIPHLNIHAWINCSRRFSNDYLSFPG